jgi:hypothetical protein
MKTQHSQSKSLDAVNRDKTGIFLEGHIKIFDPETQEILVNKRNAIHYENFSESLASSVANKSGEFIFSLALGNGGTSVDSSGVIIYLPANNTGQSADLYNPTYSKIVDNTSGGNSDPARNFMEIRHIAGTKYTDILVSCLLDYGEPAGQDAYDNSSDLNGEFVFDELGLKTESGKLLTHVVFHPVQKSLNRLIQIDYTVRIQTLTSLTSPE